MCTYKTNPFFTIDGRFGIILECKSNFHKCRVETKTQDYRYELVYIPCPDAHETLKELYV